MRLLELRRPLFLPALILGLLTTSIGALNAQTKQSIQTGTVGYEESKATITWDDMVLYDAAHPATEVTNPSNPKKQNVIPESEFRHNDLNTQTFPSDRINAAKALAKRMKQITIASPTPSATFLGLADNGTGIPPDTYGAVGPNHILVTMNSQVRVMDKTGLQLTTPVSLNSFWSGVGGTISTFDPKCVYDPTTDRFIVTALSVNSNSTVSYVLIGASATNNPTGAWHMYKILVDATGANWLDFPELGFNKNWIAIGGNLFNNASAAFSNADVFVFNKATILAGTGAGHTLFNNFTTDFCICPAFTFDPNLNDLFCLETVDGLNGGVSLFKITGTPTTPTFNSVTTFYGSIPWEKAGSSNNADTGPQSGTTVKIDLDDDRITSCVYRNNSLWFAHNAFLPVGAPTRCSVEWWQVDTIGNIIQNGLIDDATAPDTNYVYPSINVNQANDVLVGYSMLATNMFPSCGYSYHAASDAPGSMRKPYMYKAGAAYYTQNFGGPNRRWGDYSATSVDPSDTMTFYTINEYAVAHTTWGTWYAKVYQCNAPPAAPIIGPTAACSSGTTWYHVNPIPWATSYTWTITGTGWSGSSTTDSIQITAGSGAGVLKVVVNNPCGSSIADSLTIIATATPITSSPGTITYTPPLCQGSTVYFKVTPIIGVTDYVWTIVAGTGWSGTSTIDSIGLIVGSTPLTLTVAGINGCGTGPLSSRNNIVPRPIYTSTFSINNATPVQNQIITATYTGNAPANATYNWFYALGTPNPGGTVRGPQQIYWLTIGVKHINLTVTDSGCTSDQNSHVVTVGASGINEVNAQLMNVQVYPNPSDGNFSLTFKDIKHEELNIQLFDMLGQAIYNENLMPATSSFTKEINVGKLPAGIYWLNVRGKDTYFDEKLFIK